MLAPDTVLDGALLFATRQAQFHVFRVNARHQRVTRGNREACHLRRCVAVFPQANSDLGVNLIEILRLSPERLHAGTGREHALHVAGIQAKTCIVRREVESPQACVRHGSEGGRKPHAQVNGLLQRVSGQERRAHDHLEHEVPARLWVEHTAQIPVFEPHTRSRAPTFEGQREFSQAQGRRAGYVRQGLPLCNFVGSRAGDLEPERHHEGVNAPADAANVTAKSHSRRTDWDRERVGNRGSLRP